MVNWKESLKIIIVTYAATITALIFLLNPEPPWSFCAPWSTLGMEPDLLDPCMNLFEFWLTTATHPTYGIVALLLSLVALVAQKTSFKKIVTEVT